MSLERRPWPTDRRYSVGSDGTIIGPRGQLTPAVSKWGHRYVGLRLPGGKRTTKGVHVMVCEAFHGPSPEGMYATHDNGDPSDNRPENLVWKTPTGNVADRIRHGTNGRKLTNEDVTAIRAGLASGETRKCLADRFGVSAGMISHIKTGHSWHGGVAGVPLRPRRPASHVGIDR